MTEAVGKCPTCGVEINDKGVHLGFPEGNGWADTHFKKDENGYLHHYEERQP